MKNSQNSHDLQFLAEAKYHTIIELVKSLHFFYCVNPFDTVLKMKIKEFEETVNIHRKILETIDAQFLELNPSKEMREKFKNWQILKQLKQEFFTQ